MTLLAQRAGESGGDPSERQATDTASLPWTVSSRGIEYPLAQRAGENGSDPSESQATDTASVPCTVT